MSVISKNQSDWSDLVLYYLRLVFLIVCDFAGVLIFTI
jgi:hypothetical protein